MFRLFFFLCLSLWEFSKSTPIHFSYHLDGHGPLHWPGQCTSGKYQSPINIDRKHSYKYLTDGIDWRDYVVEESEWQLVNNGHTFKLVPKNERSTFYKSIFNPNVRYDLLQFHFHWGLPNGSGSEHSIDHKRNSGEIHFVNVNHEYMKEHSVSDMLENNLKDAIEVISILIQESDESNSDKYIIHKFLKEASHVREEPRKKTKRMSKSNFERLFNGLGIKYSYHGSLTTPNCNEVVRWIVFEKPLLINKNDMNELRKLEEGNGKLIKENFRPIQPLNDRKIVYFE
ncbi:hypothetical protein SNEBB_009205 [Seison nebaliae]|nr:hypothetical protein SNEBB_009205 [Seison nebaliae]